MKRLMPITLALLCLMGCISCAHLEYKIALHQVKSPEDVTRNTDSSTDPSTAVWLPNLATYEDELIKIGWGLQEKNVYFELTNHSGKTIKIPWDEVVYVNNEGIAERVIHGEVKLTDRTRHQPPSYIPNDTKLRDILMPSGRISYVNGIYGGWVQGNLFSMPKNEDTAGERFKIYFLGKKAGVYLPLYIGDEKKEYFFQMVIMDAKRK